VTPSRAPLDQPTHAGGVVVRRDGPRPRFLLVTARRSPGEWVLPKGHIEAGETAVEAAVREVLEESGVAATAGDTLGDLEYDTPGGRIRARFFVMAFQSEGQPAESRERAWVTADDARKRLRWDDARELIARASTAMNKQAAG
jgi:8-oxo-dGTP pyrophosphatase MutT (NUDIX family)